MPASPSVVVDRVSAWSLAMTAMLSVQVGAAVSVGLLERIGAGGTAWLRILLAALGFIALARPRYRQWTWRELRAPVLLGIATVGMLLGFQAAIALIPLGTVVAIEFLGPLTVAAVHAPTRRALAWPGLAFAGVLLLTRPWDGAVDIAGITLAVVGGASWGAYIVITQHVGDRFAGVDGLAVSMPVAAVVCAPFGIGAVLEHLDLRTLLLAAACAVLAPFLPWICELYALRRLSKAAFGTLMALEPAIAVVIGAAFLHQAPDILQALGTALVVLAGVAAERSGRRPPRESTDDSAVACTAEGSAANEAYDAGQAVAPGRRR